MPVLDGVGHHFLDVRGARLHVADTGGSGPPVLLVHGWPQHWWSWRAVMPLLAADFRVMALDLRGFGWSEATPRGYRKEELADDVVGVLDALEIDRVNLVGHDWGGVVGFLVCLNHTARVERFVPMNTGHVWPTLSIKDVPKQLGAMAYPGCSPARGSGGASTSRRASSARSSTRSRWAARSPASTARISPQRSAPAGRRRAPARLLRARRLRARRSAQQPRPRVLDARAQELMALDAAA